MAIGSSRSKPGPRLPPRSSPHPTGRRLRKSFGCLTAHSAAKQTLDSRDSPRDGGEDHSAWQILIPTSAEREPDADLPEPGRLQDRPSVLWRGPDEADQNGIVSGGVESLVRG